MRLLKKRQRGNVLVILILIIVALFVLKYGADTTFNDIFGNQVVSNLWIIVKNIWAVIWNLVLLILEFVSKFISNILNFLQGVKVE